MSDPDGHSEPSVRRKTTYRPFARLERFYTGESICLTADEQSLVCACADEVKIVHLATGAATRTLPGDTEPVTALAVSPNGKHVFSSSRSLTSKAWDLETGSCFRTWRAHNAPTTAMAVDASGALVATASAAHEVRVWDVPGGFCTHSFSGHSGLILAVLFHPREHLLATAGDDGNVILWDLVLKKKRCTLRGHVSAATSLAWSRDGWHLLSGGRDQTVVVWDVRTHAKTRTVAVFESVETLALLPAGAPVPGLGKQQDADKAMLFLTGGESGKLCVWDGVTGRCVHTHARAAGAAHAREVAAVLVRARSRSLVVATADCHITSFALTAKKLACSQTLLGNADQVTALCFAGSPAAAPAKSTVAPSVVGTGGSPADPAAALAPRPASVPPRVVLATNSDLIHVISTETLSCESTLPGHKDTVLSLAVTHVAAHGCWLVASAGKDKTVRLWHIESGACIAVGKGHLGAVHAVAFGAQGAPQLITGGADRLLRVWDAAAAWAQLDGGFDGSAEGRKPAKLKLLSTVAGHEKEVNCVAVAPNNRLAASGGADRLAKVWQLPALAAPLTLRGHKRGIMDVCFAPVDQAVLTASADATLRLWSVKSGACLRTFSGHGGAALRAAFLTLGTQIASTGSDGLLKLWNVASGECVGTAEAHDDKAWALDVGGAGDAALVTGAADGALALWGDQSEADKASAQAAQDDALRHQQDLENAVADRDYLKAARLAFRLKQPGRLLSVVSSILAAPAGADEAERSNGVSAAARAALARLAEGFTATEKGAALEYVRDWNTSARHCHCAQALLHAMLSTHSPEELAALGNVKDTAQALALYTERHYKRMGRLLQSTYILDYLLQGMHVYEADTTAQATPGSAEAAAPAGALHGAAVYMAGISSAATEGARDRMLTNGVTHAGGSSADRDASATLPGADLVEQILQHAERHVGSDVEAGFVEPPKERAAAESGSSLAEPVDVPPQDTGAVLAGWGVGRDGSWSGDEDAEDLNVAEEASRRGANGAAAADVSDSPEPGAGLGVFAPGKRRRKNGRSAGSPANGAAAARKPRHSAGSANAANGKHAAKKRKRRASDGDASVAAAGGSKSGKRRKSAG